jgi:glutathione S-transferase
MYDNPMITLHHLNNSRSQRILWLLEELKVPYEIKKYERDHKTMLAPPELKKIHPLGKSPVITDGDHTLAESGAIIEYLVQKYGENWKPKLEKDQLRYTYWLHFAEGSAMPPLLLNLIFSKMESKSPLLVRPVAKAIADQVNKVFINPNLKNNFEFMENELSKSEWFAGNEISGADIQMSFVIEAAKARKILTHHPRLLNWLERIHARPAYKRALERGGDYDILN